MPGIAHRFSTHGEKPPSLQGASVDRFVLATPYGPCAENGVDTTTALEVLQTVRDGWEAVRQEDYEGRTAPDFFYGLVIFGSLVKGRFHARSDVDGVLLRRPAKEPVVQQAAKHTSFIERGISKRLAPAGYCHEVNLHHKSVDLPIELNYFKQTLAAARRGDAYPIGPAAVSEGVQCLFHLSVGTSEVPHLRRQLLDGLASTEDGDMAWRAIAAQVTAFEEYRRCGQIALPDTIKEAKQYFETIPLEHMLGQPALVA